VTPNLSFLTPICLFIIQLPRATMTIKGSLLPSIPIVKAFLREILSRQTWPKICVLGYRVGKGNFVFGTPKSTSLCETRSF